MGDSPGGISQWLFHPPCLSRFSVIPHSAEVPREWQLGILKKGKASKPRHAAIGDMASSLAGEDIVLP